MFAFHPAKPITQPVLVSSPHSGTRFPEECRPHFLPEVIDRPKDTDWFLDELYDFAPSEGVGLLTASYSRYVIDLNRDPNGVSLYADGRQETQLIARNDFDGCPLYRSEELYPNEQELDRRKNEIFKPYYQKIEKELANLQKQYAAVLLFDAHSIRSRVERISKDPFPQMVLGTNEGASCHPALVEFARKHLQASGYEVALNQPFKGGNITRSLGRPDSGLHALQLEMCQSNYMDEQSVEKLGIKFHKLREDLRQLLQGLSAAVRELGGNR